MAIVALVRCKREMHKRKRFCLATIAAETTCDLLELEEQREGTDLEK